jgi:hypothetical protein
VYPPISSEGELNFLNLVTTEPKMEILQCWLACEQKEVQLQLKGPELT